MFSPFWGNSPETVVAQTRRRGVRRRSRAGHRHLRGLAARAAGRRARRQPHGRHAHRRRRRAPPASSRRRWRASPPTSSRPRPRTSSSATAGPASAACPTRPMTYADLGLKAYWFKLDLPAGMESGLEARHTYDHPYLTPPSADRKDLGSFYPMMGHGAHIPVVEVQPGDRPGPYPPLRRRPRRRHHRQSEEPARPDRGRHHPGHRHGALRADAATTPTASRSRRASWTTCCRPRRRCRHRDRPRGDAVAVHRVRRQGRRRGRAHDRSRRPGQRRRGRAGAARRHVSTSCR